MLTLAAPKASGVYGEDTVVLPKCGTYVPFLNINLIFESLVFRSDKTLNFYYVDGRGN